MYTMRLQQFDLDGSDYGMIIPEPGEAEGGLVKQRILESKYGKLQTDPYMNKC
jgi:hypothetical protein